MKDFRTIDLSNIQLYGPNARVESANGSYIQYQDGKRIFECIQYKTGDRLEIPYCNGLRDGQAYQYDRKGNITYTIMYWHGGREGFKYRYNGKNIIAEIPFHLDKQDGVERRFFPDGKIMAEIPYREGLMDGTERWYTHSGQVQYEIPHKNGKKDGIEKWYYPDKSIRCEIPYQNGIRQGVEKWYYPGGNIWMKIPYFNNQVNGMSKTYNREKLLKEMTFFHKGKRIAKSSLNYPKSSNKILFFGKVTHQTAQIIKGRLLSEWEQRSRE